MTIPDKITTWKIIEPPVLNKETGRIDAGEFELAEVPVPELASGQVLVEVAGCAICRLGADSNGAQSSIPLAYEISGTVVAGDDAWMGKEVLIPAVLSCGQCDFCVKGIGSCCDNPRKPLNHWQIPSCFSSHILNSGSSLFEIRHRKRSLPLEHLAGVFDALMTPFQALQRASLGSGDPVIVIGDHEMVQYLVQMTKASGAGTVIAIEWNQLHSQESVRHGAHPEFIINCTNKNAETITAEVKMYIDKERLVRSGWKVFAVTGSKSAQETVRYLLGYASKIVVLGCSTAQAKDWIGKLEETDAEMMGVCGCLPGNFPQILKLVTSGEVQVSPFVLTRPMSWIHETFQEINSLAQDKRIILTTDDFGLDFNPEPKSCR